MDTLTKIGLLNILSCFDINEKETNVSKFILVKIKIKTEHLGKHL